MAALASGVLLALSFPRYGHPAFAFIALAPLLFALSGWNGRAGRLPGVSAMRGLWLGIIAGFVHFAGTLYWTSTTVSTFGGLPVAFGIFVAGLLAFALALFIGGVGAVVGLAIRRFGAAGLWLAPFAWVAFEYLRGTYFFGGFPWIPLGNTMVTLLPIAQLASILGVYGLSFFVAFLNAGFTAAALEIGRRRLIVAAVPVLSIVLVAVWGGMRLQADTLNDGPAIKVGLIQGNIAQNEKWDPKRARMILNRYLELTREAAQNGARVIIWPEASTPFYFEESRGGEEIRALVRQLGTPLLLGSDEQDDGPPDASYNSAFMLDAGGLTAAVYRKMQLVPFGEYVPLQKYLFFIGPLVEAVSAFSAGTRVTMLPAEGHMLSTAICYDVAFPALQREAVRQGSELLTTITNDAWYGESSAPFQHFELATMRAIEQGRYMARSANTGFSGIIDPYGRVVARSRLFETVALVGDVRFVQARTVYATIGDLAAYVSVAVVIVAIGLIIARGPKNHANG